MEELIKPALDFIQSIGFIGLLTILAIPKLRKFIFNGNDSGVKKELQELKDNHFHELGQKLERIIEQNVEIITILKNRK